jgi:hypothetical protein
VAKSTKVSVKVKGSAAGVKKALGHLLDAPVEKVTPLREADFRTQQKKKGTQDAD